MSEVVKVSLEDIPGAGYGRRSVFGFVKGITEGTV